MICLGKGLNIAVVRNGDGRHAPLISLFYNIGAFRDAVHVAHLRVTVKLDPLYLGGVLAFCREIRYFHDAADGADDDLMVEIIHLCHAAKANEGPLFEIRKKRVGKFCPDEDLAVNRIREIRDAEADDGLVVPDIMPVDSEDLPVHRHLADFPDDLGKAHICRVFIDVPAVYTVRIIRKPIPLLSLLSFLPSLIFSRGEIPSPAAVGISLRRRTGARQNSFDGVRTSCRLCRPVPDGRVHFLILCAGRLAHFRARRLCIRMPVKNLLPFAAALFKTDLKLRRDAAAPRENSLERFAHILGHVSCKAAVLKRDSDRPRDGIVHLRAGKIRSGNRRIVAEFRGKRIKILPHQLFRRIERRKRVTLCYINLRPRVRENLLL